MCLFCFISLFRHFDIKLPAEAAQGAALFSVPDFVGDACKAIASRIRGAVASVQFDDFHKVHDTPVLNNFIYQVYMNHSKA